MGVLISIAMACCALTAGGERASTGCPPPFFPVERLRFGESAVAFEPADFNGDGCVDLALIGGSTMRLAIGFAEPDGAMVSFDEVDVGGEPCDVVAGDWDGDGDNDLAIAARALDQVKLVRNDGDGVFVVTTSLAAGDGVCSLAVGDVDHDGDPDLVAANGLAESVSLWLNDGSGGFEPRSDLDVGPSPHSVRLADIDVDGLLDVQVAHATIDASTVSVLRGLGDGSFAPPASIEAGRSPTGLVVVDFDGDGLPDLAVANVADHTISIVRSTTTPGGDIAFEPPETLAAPEEPRWLEAYDLFGDRRPELFVAGAQGEAVWRYENVDGALERGIPAIAAASPRALLVDDLDGDGLAEVVVGQANQDLTPLVAHLQPSGFFAEEFPLFTGIVSSLVAGKVLGADDRPDLVAGRNGGVVDVWRNDRGEAFVLDATIDLGGTGSVVALAASDIDGDGDDDLLAGRPSGVSVVRSLGVAGLAEPMLFPLDHGVDAIAVDDIDADGDMDAVAIGALANDRSKVTVLRNHGDGSFMVSGQFTFSGQIRTAGALDVDGDGQRDIVLCGVDQLPVLIADSNGGFSAAQPFVVGAFPIARAAIRIDWDGDGDEELLLVGIGIGLIEPFLGGAVWLATWFQGIDPGGVAPALVDVDGDGLEDVLYVNPPSWTPGGPVRVAVRIRSRGGGLGWPRHYGRAELAAVSTPSAAIADFDGDGRIDAVFSAASVVWMLQGTCGAAPCAGDLDRSGVVDGADLGVMLAAWGAVASDGVSDLDHDGVIDAGDLGILLAAWGPCRERADRRQ